MGSEVCLSVSSRFSQSRGKFQQRRVKRFLCIDTRMNAMFSYLRTLGTFVQLFCVTSRHCSPCLLITGKDFSSLSGLCLFLFCYPLVFLPIHLCLLVFVQLPNTHSSEAFSLLFTPSLPRPFFSLQTYITKLFIFNNHL